PAGSAVQVSRLCPWAMNNCRLSYLRASGAALSLLLQRLILLPVSEPLRSPPSCKGVGTSVVELSPLTWRRLSKFTKKNVLFFWIGPPILPPNWLRRYSGKVFWKKGGESNLSLRKNS